MTATRHTLPKIASAEEWQTARDALLVKEKELMKAQDHLAAERRRLPMVPFTKPYEFDSATGRKSLLDLFDGRSQLIVYHFMLHPGDDAGCPGCSLLVDNMPHLAHLHARDTTLTVVAPATLAEIERYRTRMGWDVPWVSAHGSDFTADCGVGPGFGVSVFLRDGDAVYRTYFTPAAAARRSWRRTGTSTPRRWAARRPGKRRAAATTDPAPGGAVTTSTDRPARPARRKLPARVSGPRRPLRPSR